MTRGCDSERRTCHPQQTLRCAAARALVALSRRFAGAHATKANEPGLPARSPGGEDGRTPRSGYVRRLTKEGPMGDDGFEHGQIEANGISIHTVSVGTVRWCVFCHGFPESWYSWRHQLPAVAAAGYRAVALDMRGYGPTSQPADIGAYTVSHLVGDVVGAVAALGEREAVVVGHDWGAPVAWYAALMRPDVFRAVAALERAVHPADRRAARRADAQRPDAGQRRRPGVLPAVLPGARRRRGRPRGRRRALGARASSTRSPATSSPTACTRSAGTATSRWARRSPISSSCPSSCRRG